MCGTFKDFLHELNFWMSSGGTRSVIHFDADHNIHCLVAGRKDFMMIDPEFAKYLNVTQVSQITKYSLVCLFVCFVFCFFHNTLLDLFY